MCKCGGYKKLCPFSLGLAIGLTCAIGMFLWALWLMYYGTMPMMADYKLPMPTFKDAAIFSLIGLVKGFIFGFFVALFYDWIYCCCRKKSCKCQNCGNEKCCCSIDKSDVNVNIPRDNVNKL